MHPIWVQVSEDYGTKRNYKRLLTVFSMFLTLFLVTIVAIIAADNSHLPFGFIAAAKAQRAYPNKLVAFRDALYDVAMAVLAMNDIIFSCRDGSRESN
jgi:hypothetical protein